MALEPPVALVELTGLFLCSIAYGVYLVTYGTCLHALLWGRARKAGCCSRNRLLVAVSILICSMITLKIALIFRTNIHAFAFYAGSGGPSMGFVGDPKSLEIIQAGISTTLIAIGDGMLIYRCFVVFSSDWLAVLVPAMLLTQAAALFVAVIILAATDSNFFNFAVSGGGSYKTLTNIGLSVTLVINLLTTGLIAWKLWRIHRDVANAISISTRRPSTLSRLLRIVVESQLLYTVFVTISLVTQCAGDLVQSYAENMMGIVIGISFNLIIIRMDATWVGNEGRNTRPTSSFIIDIPAENRSHTSEEVPRGAIIPMWNPQAVQIRDMK